MLLDFCPFSISLSVWLQYEYILIYEELVDNVKARTTQSPAFPEYPASDLPPSLYWCGSWFGFIARISSSIFLEMSTTIFELEKIFYGTFGVEHLEIVRYKIVKNILQVFLWAEFPSGNFL